MKTEAQQDEVPADLVHDPAHLQQVAIELNNLIDGLLALSTDVIHQAAIRETAQSGAEALEQEAIQVLANLLEDPDSAELSDEEGDGDDAQGEWRLRASLARALNEKVDQSALDEHTVLWITDRGRDLARTMATALLNAGSRPEDRLEALEFSLRAPESPLSRSMQEIRRRFDLTDSEVYEYLKNVGAGFGIQVVDDIHKSTYSYSRYQGV